MKTDKELSINKEKAKEYCVYLLEESSVESKADLIKKAKEELGDFDIVEDQALEAWDDFLESVNVCWVCKTNEADNGDGICKKCAYQSLQDYA